MHSSERRDSACGDARSRPILDRYQGFIRTLARPRPMNCAKSTCEQGGSSMSFKSLRQLGFLAALAFATGTVAADVELRVESRPIVQPIDAYVLVTDSESPVVGLTAGDFSITLDGMALEEFEFSLPPAQDPSQNVSTRPCGANEPILLGARLLRPHRQTGRGRLRIDRQVLGRHRVASQWGARDTAVHASRRRRRIGSTEGVLAVSVAVPIPGPPGISLSGVAGGRG